MTTENTQSNETRQTAQGNRPTHTVKMRRGHGGNATYEQIGVAWKNKDGAVYVKLHGTQIVDSGFTLYELSAKEEAGE